MIGSILGSKILTKRQANEENSSPSSNGQTNPQAPQAGANGQGNMNFMPFGPPPPHNPALYPQLPPQGAFLPPFSQPNHGPLSHQAQRLYPNFPTAHQSPPFDPMNAGPQPVPFNSVDNHQQTNADRPAKFINNLGSRLLSMFGIGDKNKSDSSPESRSELQQQQPPSPQQQQGGLEREQMEALKNATVLQQLNRGMHSVFSNLSNMWNSTVQQQLNLLQDRMRQEVSNSSNPVQQRLAQQVPAFFKSMVARISDAQDNLNRFWKQVSNNNGTANLTALENQANIASSRSLNSDSGNLFSAPIDGFFPSAAHPASNGQAPPPPNAFGGFFDRVQHTFGFGGGHPVPNGAEHLIHDIDPAVQLNGRQTTTALDNNQSGAGGDNKRGLGASVADFWHQQVQPQMARVQNKISQVWQDLTHNGVVNLPPHQAPAYGGFMQPVGGGQGDIGQASSASIDNLLNSIDVNNPLYTLTDPVQDSTTANSNNKNSPEQQSKQSDLNSVGSKIQTSVINMQRDLNKMWHGLTDSLQSTLGNVRGVLNPHQQQQQQPVAVAPLLYGPAPGPEFGSVGGAQESIVTRQKIEKEGSEPNNNNNGEQSAVNEIDGKIKEISRLQRDANTVYNVIQTQQQLQEQQQRVPFTDRFRNFFQNINIAEHVPQGFRDSLSDVQVSVRDFYHNVSPWAHRDNSNNNNKPKNNSDNNNNSASTRQPDNSATTQSESSSSTTTTTTTNSPSMDPIVDAIKDETSATTTAAPVE